MPTGERDQEMSQTEERYDIWCQDPGCPECGHAALWTVLDKVEDCQISMAFEDREHTEYIAERMNEAFEKGKEAAIATLPADWQTDSSLETWFPLTAEELTRIKRERDELNHNVAHWGMVELAVRNPNVASYMEHWEGRAIKAENALMAEKDREARDFPRVVVCAVIIHDGFVLLERRAPAGIVGLDGKWDLPGGKLECGESPEDAVAREIREELGVDITVKSLIPLLVTSTWQYPNVGRRHWFLVPYLCEITRGQFKLSDTLAWWPTSSLLEHCDILPADLAIIRTALGDDK